MAKGDIVFFEQSYVDTDEGIHNKETDTFKLGLIDSTLAPTAADADPRWGAGGSTNLSSNQVTPGGNYVSGGPTIPNPTVTLVSGKSRFDADDIPTIAQDGANPNNVRWGIIYNDTAAGKNALAYLDFGAVSDFQAGDTDIAWNPSGISETGAAA